MNHEASFSRRVFVKSSALALGACNFGAWNSGAWSQDRLGTDVRRDVVKTRVLPPRDRVPASFIIDDSTCLVNMGHFCTPQFAACYPSRAEYAKDWRSWPREIPDSFVREFGEWCGEHGVKGKYSIVPYPACVGWLDRELPGWSRQDLQSSLKLVRDLMVPNWDIHPEMITHTRVIDLKTGRPVEAINPSTMENSYPQDQKSVDELAAYLAYALRLLKNCDLPCEGITTPGGFGSRVKDKLPLAVDQAVRDVYGVDLPHYFKYVRTGDQNNEPVMEAVRGEDTNQPMLTVNVPAGTGDWYGGWQGDRTPEPDRYLSRDGQSGRLAELIKRRQPATFLCHWPGMLCNGTRAGFRAFQRNVMTLNEVHGDDIVWMKLSEIARYEAAKKLTRLRFNEDRLQLSAPFATEDFTIHLSGNFVRPALWRQGENSPLTEVKDRRALQAGCWTKSDQGVIVCFDLPAGESQLRVETV